MCVRRWNRGSRAISESSCPTCFTRACSSAQVGRAKSLYQAFCAGIAERPESVYPTLAAPLAGTLGPYRNCQSTNCDQGPTAMTRVLMVIPQYPYPVLGGLERQAHELALALRVLGVNVQVLSGRVMPTQPDLEDVEGISVHRLPWTHRRWARFLRMPLHLFFALYRLRT